MGRGWAPMIAGVHYVRRARAAGPPKWYIYAWRGGPQIMTAEGRRKPALTPDALRCLSQAQTRSASNRDGLLAGLITAWRASPEWRALSINTRRTWGNALVAIEDKWGKTPISLWSDDRMTSKIVAWRNTKAGTPRTADIAVQVLRALLEFGRLSGAVRINVASGIPRLYRGANRADIVWTDEECDRFEHKALALNLPHIAQGMRLAALTGLRCQDLVSLTWGQVGERAIVKKALKESRGKRRTVTVPRLSDLDALLAELRAQRRKPGVDTVLVNSYGRAWAGSGFGGSFNKVRNEADITHTDLETGKRSWKHLHDLRGTFCTKLILAGATNQEAADVMGWSPDQVQGIRRMYVDQDRIGMAIAERLSGVR